VFASNFGVKNASEGKFWFGMGSNPETYCSVQFDTQSEAEAEAVHRMEEDDADTAVIGQGEEVHIRVPDADDVIEMISMDVYEQCGEGASDYLDSVPKEQKAELTDAIEKAVGDWLTKNNLWPIFCKIGEVKTLRRQDRSAARSACEVCGRGLIAEDHERQDGMCAACAAD